MLGYVLSGGNLSASPDGTQPSGVRALNSRNSRRNSRRNSLINLRVRNDNTNAEQLARMPATSTETEMVVIDHADELRDELRERELASGYAVVRAPVCFARRRRITSGTSSTWITSTPRRPCHGTLFSCVTGITG